MQMGAARDGSDPYVGALDEADYSGGSFGGGEFREAGASRLWMNDHDGSTARADWCVFEARWNQSCVMCVKGKGCPAEAGRYKCSWAHSPIVAFSALI
jgi:hypothetical protein